MNISRIETCAYTFVNICRMRVAKLTRLYRLNTRECIGDRFDFASFMLAFRFSWANILRYISKKISDNSSASK